MPNKNSIIEKVSWFFVKSLLSVFKNIWFILLIFKEMIHWYHGLESFLVFIVPRIHMLLIKFYCFLFCFCVTPGCAQLLLQVQDSRIILGSAWVDNYVGSVQ